MIGPTPGGAAVFGAGHPKWHALAEPSRFNAFVDEWRADWKAKGLGGKTPTLGRLVVSGHSRAYDFLEPLAESRNDAQMSQGALAVLSDIWAFDTTYAGRIDRWTDWAKASPRCAWCSFTGRAPIRRPSVMPSSAGAAATSRSIASAKATVQYRPGACRRC